MEVGCPGTWGLELLTPNPGSKSILKACPTRNPATSPARHTQLQPKHPSHRARSSVEIITVITNNNNNNNDNNNKVIVIKGIGGWEKMKMPQPLSTVKLRPHVIRITADLGTQETALHQAYYSNANPNNRKCHSKLTIKGLLWTNSFMLLAMRWLKCLLCIIVFNNVGDALISINLLPDISYRVFIRSRVPGTGTRLLWTEYPAT